MVKAFVFGKFLPFHKGHEAMINFALRKCDTLSVLICCSEKENISGVVRRSWIENSFKGNSRVNLQIFHYSESEFPNTSKASREVAKVWSKVFREKFPDHARLITSEPYGDYIAEYLEIEHVPFDPSRTTFPVSASAIRKDLFLNWKFLPESVKPYFAVKVVVLGTESTGKSTLTQDLSTHFRCSFVSESGREIIADSNSFTMEDLHSVAKEHANQINKAVQFNSPLIIIDTDIHITKSYSRFRFGTELNVDDATINSNKASLYLYLNNDVEYFQDGTRLNKTERDLLDVSHRKVLAENRIDIVEISGSWKARFNKAVLEIPKLLNNNVQ